MLTSVSSCFNTYIPSARAENGQIGNAKCPYHRSDTCCDVDFVQHLGIRYSPERLPCLMRRSSIGDDKAITPQQSDCKETARCRIKENL